VQALASVRVAEVAELDSYARGIAAEKAAHGSVEV